MAKQHFILYKINWFIIFCKNKKLFHYTYLMVYLVNATMKSFCIYIFLKKNLDPKAKSTTHQKPQMRFQKSSLCFKREINRKN